MNYPTHPLAELIPAMSDQEFVELRDDIQANGLHEPVWLFEGKVLDGRHRSRACAELGIEPPTREYEGVEAARFVLSMNVHRRHLTTTQKALIAKAAMPHFKEAAKERQREHAGTAPGQPSNTSGIPARSVSPTGNLARDEAAKEIGARFLGILLSGAREMQLTVHGLSIEDCRQVLSQARGAGLLCELESSGGSAWCRVQDADRRRKLVVFLPRGSDIVEFGASDVPDIEVGVDAEMHVQCAMSLQRAKAHGVLIDAVLGAESPAEAA